MTIWEEFQEMIDRAEKTWQMEGAVFWLHAKLGPLANPMIDRINSDIKEERQNG